MSKSKWNTFKPTTSDEGGGDDGAVLAALLDDAYGTSEGARDVEFDIGEDRDDE